MTFDEATSTLSPSQRLLAEVIWSYACDDAGNVDTGGTQPFYSPQEWRQREEEWGTESLLIVVYDGVPTLRRAICFGTQPQALYNELQGLGAWSEEATGWYSCVHQA